MKRHSLKLDNCSIAAVISLLVFGSPLYGQIDQGSPRASQEDATNLQRAHENFTANKLDEAERLCISLVNKGGTVASDAQELLQRIRSRKTCVQDATRALPLSTRGECLQAMQLLEGIKQRCADYPGLETLFRHVRAQCPGQPRPSGLDEGISLFNEGSYRAAQEFFERLQFSNPNSAELQDWIQKAREAQKEVDRLVGKIKVSIARNHPGNAEEELAALSKLAPKDGRIPMFRTKIQHISENRDAEQKQDRSGARDALLKEAIRQFYAGQYSQADELLNQIVGQPGNRKALAYFYKGAIACTDYFLTGAKDQQKQTRAREFFSKAREADDRFKPPRDWFSPKIIEVYEKTMAGS